MFYDALQQIKMLSNHVNCSLFCHTPDFVSGRLLDALDTTIHSLESAITILERFARISSPSSSNATEDEI
jgi:hypothetical protein